MARQATKKQGEWWVFVATIMLVGFVAAWALIPSRVLEQTWQAERAQLRAWAGERTEHWIATQAMPAIFRMAEDAVKTAGGLGGSGIERWLADRTYASVLWLSIMTFRTYALVMWLLLGIPLLLAAAVDGFYVREIRKNAFISQSPIRHKIGVHFMRIVGIAIVIWLMLPVPMPLIVAPTVLLFKALSIWLWMGNLQKRL
jgi:hypothetical protein